MLQLRALSFLRTAISVYEACAVDVVRAFRGSWFIGTFLLVIYLASFFVGILIGASIYELAGPLLDVLLMAFRSPADLVADVFILVLLLYIGSASSCLISRTIVRAVTYLLFEMRGDVLFYLLVLTMLGCVFGLAVICLSPLLVSDDALSFAAGATLLATIAVAAITSWVFFRYRWRGHSAGRKFDRDIGLAWSHMSDPRRARFGFDGRG